MRDDQSCREIALQFLKSLAIDCRSSTSSDGWKTKVIVEKEMQILIRSPVKLPESKAVANDAIKLLFELVELGEVFVDDFGPAGLVDEDPATTHFEDGGLEIAGEGIGPRRLIIELRKEDIENLAGYDAVETVVDPFALGGGDVVGARGVGLDDFHGKNFSEIDRPISFVLMHVHGHWDSTSSPY